MMVEAFRYICIANPLNVNIVNQRPNGGYVYSVIQEVEEYQELRKQIVQFAINGEWTRNEYRWVDIRHIEPRDVWKPESLQYSLGLIERGEGLIRVLLMDGKVNGVERYTLLDGIHRIHALMNKGFTHVLALITDIRVQERPPLPPGVENLFPYATLEEMALLNCAAMRLRGQLDVGPVCLISRESPYNVIEFSILRNGVDRRNVNALPPDCRVTVTGSDFENGGFNITTAAILFGNQHHFLGSYEEVSANILRMLGVIN